MNEKISPKIRMKKAILTTVLPMLIMVGLTGGVYAFSLTAPSSLDYQASPANTTLQSYVAADCAVMDTYMTVILTDERDGKTYRIRKMPDGRCWMIDNLALATTATITSANTDIDTDVAGSFIALWNGLNGNPVQDAITRSVNGACAGLGGITGTGAYLTCDGTSSATTGANTNHHFIAFSNPSLTDNPYYNECTAGDSINPNSLTGCGYLYNWYTATAGSGNYSKTSTNVNSSICPAGWNLPKGALASVENEFGILNNAMSTGNTTSSTTNTPATQANWRSKGPFEGALSGNYYSSFTNSGYYGYYWSSRADSAANAYPFYFNYSSLSPGLYANVRNNGMAIRCVL